MADIPSLDLNPDEVPDAPADTDEPSDLGETQESNEIHEQAKGFVGNDEEEEGVEAKGEEGDEEEVKAKPKTSLKGKKEVQAARPRENHRIRELVERSKAAESRISQYEDYLSKMQERTSQMERQYQSKLADIEKSHAVSAKELEILRAKAEQAEEAGLSDVDRFQRKILRDAESNVGKKYEQRFTEQDRRFQSLVQEMNRERQERDVRGRMAHFESEADRAIAQALKGRAPEKVQALTPKTKTAVLNWAAAHNVTPAQAIKDLHTWAHEYVLSGMKAKNVVNREKAEAAKKIPANLPTGQRPAKGQPRVDAKTAKKRGFNSPLEAMVNDNPPPWAQ